MCWNNVRLLHVYTPVLSHYYVCSYAAGLPVCVLVHSSTALRLAVFQHEDGRSCKMKSRGTQLKYFLHFIAYFYPHYIINGKGFISMYFHKT